MLSEVKLLIPASIRSAYAGEQITGTNQIYDSNWNNNAGATQDVINNSLKYAIDNIDVDLSSYYQKPQSGIPKNDLANTVKSSLDKADAASVTLEYYREPGTTSQLNSIADLKYGTIAFDKTKGELVQYKNSFWKNVDTLHFDINDTVENIPPMESNYVSYSRQGNKSDDQKAVARENIGAISALELNAAIYAITDQISGGIELPIEHSWNGGNSLNAIEKGLVNTRFINIEDQIQNKADKSDVCDIDYYNGVIRKTANEQTDELVSADNILTASDASKLKFINSGGVETLKYINVNNSVEQCLVDLDQYVKEDFEKLDEEYVKNTNFNSALSALNVAIGNRPLNDTVVHRSGNELVSGDKTFSGTLAYTKKNSGELTVESGVLMREATTGNILSTPIKTINNQTLLGSGNIDISGGSAPDLSNYVTTSTLNSTISTLDNAVVHKTNNVTESINGNKSFSGNTEFGAAGANSTSKTTINGSIIIPNYTVDGILTVGKNEQNQNAVISDSSIYMKYKGIVPKYTNLPNGNYTKKGDTYFVEDLNAFVVAHDTTSDVNDNLYVYYLRPDSTTATITLQNVHSDNSQTKLVNYNDLVNNLNSVYTTYSSYPAISYLYHQLIPSGESERKDLKVIPVLTDEYGIIIVLATSTAIFGITKASNESWNTWNCNKIISNSITDITNITNGITDESNIRTFYTFNGGVEWTKPADTSLKTINGMSLKGKGNVLITPSNSVISATSGHITDIILNISNTAANNTIEYEDLDTMIQYGFIPVLCDQDGQCYHLSKIVKGGGGSDYYEFSELVCDNSWNFEFRIRRCNSATGPDWTYDQHSFTI